jgi:hypothetical protein
VGGEAAGDATAERRPVDGVAPGAQGRLAEHAACHNRGNRIGPRRPNVDVLAGVRDDLAQPEPPDSSGGGQHAAGPGGTQ